MRSLLLPLVTAVLLAAPALAQANTAAQTPVQADVPTIKNDARLVVIPTVVRDKHGAILGDLTKENFTLLVDDATQTLRYFDHDADAALTLGLLVDTSRSQTSVLDDERAGSLAFLQTAVTPGRDQAFVMQFAHTVELLQDVTDSRPKLQQALQQLDTTAPSQPDPHDSQSDPDTNQDARGGHRHGGGFSGGGTALYDAVYLAAHEVLPKQKARRAIILLTDGVDSGSKTTLPGAIEAAQRADTIVYAIYYKGEEHRDSGGGRDSGGHGGGFPGGRGGGGGRGGQGGGGQGGGGQGGGGRGGDRVDGKKVLERLCGETGGRVFEVSKKETVAKIYTEIGAELRAQYRLGFTPTGQAAAEGYHTLALALTGRKDKNEQTQARDGYYTR